jgi:plasmid maintenance system antidote protein VapI
MSADFWMNLQSAYELDLARQQNGKAIQRIPKRNNITIKPRPAA